MDRKSKWGKGTTEEEVDLDFAIAGNSGFMGGNVSGPKVRWGSGLKRVKEKPRVEALCRHGSEIAHVCWAGLGAGYIGGRQEFLWYGVAVNSECWWYAISSDGEQFDCRGEIGHFSKLAIVGGDWMIGQQRVCWVGIEDRSDCCVCWYF